MVAVFLAEEGDGAKLFSLLDGYVAVVGEGNVLAYACVYYALYLLNLLVGYLLEV